MISATGVREVRVSLLAHAQNRRNETIFKPLKKKKEKKKNPEILFLSVSLSAALSATYIVMYVI